jgi:DNA repair exonuclease SbcCD nuclease subunit
MQTATTTTKPQQINARYALLIGDLHFGRRSNDQQELDISEEYFHRFVFPELEKLNEQYGQENVVVIQLGDVYDNRSVINVEVQNRVLDIFARLSQTNETIILVGNHDKFNETNATTKALSFIPNVITVDNPMTLHSHDKTLTFLPAIEKRDRLQELITGLEPSDYLFGHDDIAGFAHEGVPVSEDKAVSVSLFEKFGRCFFGHIHKFQSRHNVVYVGSAYQTRINEARNDYPRLTVLDLQSGSVQFIENTVTPRYYKVLLDDVLEATLEDIQQKYMGQRLIVYCRPSDFVRYQLYKITELLSTVVYSVVYKQLNEKETNTDDGVAITEAVQRSLEEDLTDYIDSLDSEVVSKTLVSFTPPLKERLKKTLKRLYTEATEKTKEVEI